jgi:hypothetical protein
MSNNLNELFGATVKELNYIVACILQVNMKSASGFTRRVGQAAASKIAAAGAVSGVLGAVAAFGTAGTGTAIASLSGAAATSATMAWIGGLLGGGVALGSLMTGGLALAVGVGAYKLMGSTARPYSELPVLEREIVDACIILIKAFEDVLEKRQTPSLMELEAVYERSLTPLYLRIRDNEKEITSRLDFKNSFAFSVNAVPDFRRNVIDPFWTVLSKDG